MYTPMKGQVRVCVIIILWWNKTCNTPTRNRTGINRICDKLKEAEALTSASTPQSFFYKTNLFVVYNSIL